MLTVPVEALGFQLWGIEYVQAGNHSVLRVFIDGENGINIEDCANVSRQVSAVLDVEDPISTEYTLEVSSPGVDRPLFTAEQYASYIGEDVKLQLTMPVAGMVKSWLSPWIISVKATSSQSFDGFKVNEARQNE